MLEKDCVTLENSVKPYFPIYTLEKLSQAHSNISQKAKSLAQSMKVRTWQMRKEYQKFGNYQGPFTENEVLANVPVDSISIDP